MSQHVMPGQHTYQGMEMNQLVPADVLDRIPGFEFRDNDVLLDSYPKTGNTWLQHITWLIVNGCDIETSRKIPLLLRSPFLDVKVEHGAVVDLIQHAPSPRIIKSHLPHSFYIDQMAKSGAEGFKTVIGMRNVKDTLVSYYHFYRMNKNFGGFDRSFDEFFNMFKAKRLMYGDYFDHVLGWWTHKENSKVHFVKYEDLIADLKGEITKLAIFLGKDLKDSELNAIVEESRFKSMQENPMTNMDGFPDLDNEVSKFIRKGEIGDWKNYFTAEHRKYVDDLCAEKFAGTELLFSDMPLMSNI